MADTNDIVYVPQQSQTTWFHQPTFWMGVASSLVATAIFWYIVHDVWPIDDPPTTDNDEDIL